MTESSYATFTYIRYTNANNLFCNHYPSDRFLTAYSGRLCNPSLPGSGLEMVPFISGTLRWSDLTLRPRDLSSFATSETGVGVYDVVGDNPYAAYYQIAQTPFNPSSTVMSRYDIHFVLEYRQYAERFAIRWTLDNPLPSPFLVSLRDSSYKVYQDSTYDLWYV